MKFRGMKKRKIGFTLFEVVLSLAIASIIMMGVLTMSGTIFKGFSEASKEYDLQTDVRNTMQSVYNVLKETKQVHLVGETVYNGDSSKYDKLDQAYNFIGLNKDAVNGDKMVNLSYSPDKKAWYDFPLTSG